MIKNPLDKLNQAANKLSSSISINDFVIPLIFIFLVIFLTTAGFISGISKFSPDSWSYYELSKNIFENNFYNFNTYRSYYSEKNSTSFPFGYPFIIAIAQYIFGHHPFTSVVVNMILALSSWALCTRLLDQLKFSRLSSIAIATSLILSPAYLDEIFAGRSIPAAILLCILCYSAFISHRFILCGILLGLSALIRFDHLAYGLIFQLLIYILDHRNVTRSLSIGLGFIIGILPWALYSQLYFDKFWVSDNSWVALSALPAHVVDYPAAATSTAFEYPALWAKKIISNLSPLFISVAKSSINFPLLPILIGLCVLLSLHIRKSGKIKMLILCSFALVASLSPFLLTGYFASRYFSLFFFIFSSLLVFSIEATPLDQVKLRNYRYLLIFSICFSTLLGSVFMVKIGEAWLKGHERLDKEMDIILDLERCHLHHPDATFIFGKSARFAAQYGAITGNRTAFLPSNFSQMSDADKSNFFERMKPYLLIEKPRKANYRFCRRNITH